MISILAYVAIGFLALRSLVILVNLFHAFFSTGAGEPGPLDLSILIPCRNEEKHIGLLLDCLLSLDNTPVEILVCDDQSEDKTYDIAAGFAARHSRVRAIKGLPLPPGYTGKNWACVQLGKQARASYMLFLDADMAIKGTVLDTLVSRMTRKRLDLLSVFPTQKMLSPGERATVPVMNWILLSLLPLPLVRASRMKSFSAANGQFMLYRSTAYRELEPHRQLRSNPVEDIASMKLFKRNKRRCATFTGDKRIYCRMYHGRKEALQGFAKNVLHYFSCNVAWILFFVLFTTFGLPIIALWSIPWFLASLVTAAAGRVMVSLASRQHPLYNLVLSPLQHYNFLCMLVMAYRQKWRGTLTWKDRQIAVP